MIRNTTLICTAGRLAFPLYRNETTLNEYQSLSIPAVHCLRICCHRSQLCHPTSRHFRNPSSFYKSLPFPNAYCSLSCIYKELYQRHPRTHSKMQSIFLLLSNETRSLILPKRYLGSNGEMHLLSVDFTF